MEKYKFTNSLNEKIVEGLMKGYQEYIMVRREKYETMEISGAYAWVKGNHIDDQVAKICASENVDFEISKAGVSWQYLQFKHQQEKILFIIRNAKYFNDEEVSKGRDVYGRARHKKADYLERLVDINTNVDFSELSQKEFSHTKTIQLELTDLMIDEEEIKAIEELESTFERFYIVTYEIDEAHLISEISLFMPNQENNKAYIIEDLTPYIKPEHVPPIDDKTKEILVTNAINDTYGFDLEIIGEDKQKKNKPS